MPLILIRPLIAQMGHVILQKVRSHLLLAALPVRHALYWDAGKLTIAELIAGTALHRHRPRPRPPAAAILRPQNPAFPTNTSLREQPGIIVSLPAKAYLLSTGRILTRTMIFKQLMR